MHKFCYTVAFFLLAAAAANAQSKPASAPASGPAKGSGGDSGQGVVEVKGNKVTVPVPGHPVKVSFTADEFKAEQNSQFGGRSLVYGGILKEAVINIYYEQNFPFFSSLNWREQWTKRPGFQGFLVNSIACAEFTNDAKGAFVQSFFHAHYVTNAFAFDISVSVARIELKGQAPTPKFSREDFIKIVKSFSVEGEPDFEKLRLPKEVYDFRDVAAKHDGDQLNWTSKECGKSPDDWPVHFYYGALALKRKQNDFASNGFSRAAELLSKKEGRTPREEFALLDAFTGGQTSLFTIKRYRDASVLYQKMLEVVKSESGDEFKKARDESIFNLAICYAQIAQPERAIETLKNAVAANPQLKRRAREEALFAPIRNSREFAKIVDAN